MKFQKVDNLPPDFLRTAGEVLLIFACGLFIASTYISNQEITHLCNALPYYTPAEVEICE